ncbi:MAG: nucleotide exchange factor GrpE [Thermodesulfobacteriota bacterium]|nr:nucleotide exchange factor GrpE [Thermodesulfobacteriota bacterium]
MEKKSGGKSSKKKDIKDKVKIDLIEKPTEEDTKNLPAKLEEKEKEAAENYDKFLRASAELDNYKKRVTRERTDLIKYGNESLIKDMLLIIDSLDRALEHAGNSEDFDAFIKGLMLVQEQFLGCLEKHGVAKVQSTGMNFDPNVHEAVLQVESENHEENNIVEEFEKGYLLNGRLLRPARVSVSKSIKKRE